MRLFTYQGRYEPKGKFSNLLYVVARHAWADPARKQAKQPAANSEMMETSIASPDFPRDDCLDVQAAQEELSDKIRTVVVLSAYRGLKQQEIAEVPGDIT